MSLEENVLIQIGNTGVSKTSDLISFFGENISRSSLYHSVKTLRDSGLLITTDVKLGGAGQYNFLVFELSTKGKISYQKLTSKEPKESEKQCLLNRYGRLEKAYLVKEVRDELVRRGRTVRPLNRTYDLSVRQVKEEEKILVIDRVFDEDVYYRIFRRIYEEERRFYFIASSEMVLYRDVKRLFFKWLVKDYGGLHKVPHQTTAHFSTLSKVRNQDQFWEKIMF